MKYKFKTKSGNLTPYALACGYIEQRESEGVRLKLWKESGTFYHVCAINIESGSRIFWDSFERLTDARKRFVSI